MNPQLGTYAAVETAFAALRVAQIAHGDLSEPARQARQQIERAWQAWYGGESVNRSVNQTVAA